MALLLSNNSSWSIVDLAKTDVAHVTPQKGWSAKIEKETKKCHNGHRGGSPTARIDLLRSHSRTEVDEIKVVTCTSRVEGDRP